MSWDKINGIRVNESGIEPVWVRVKKDNLGNNTDLIWGKINNSDHPHYGWDPNKSSYGSKYHDFRK